MQSETMNQKELEALAREIAKGVKTEADLAAVTRTLTKTLIETALKAELSDHLGYEAGDPAGANTGNSRNGGSGKTVVTQSCPVEIETPRDRNGDFEPRLVRKRQRRVTVIDDKILPLYARGMSTREIAATIEDLYGAEVSASLISKVTEAVIDEVIAWQARPLDGCYPIVYLDGLSVKIRHNKQVINKTIYLALGLNVAGEKELLGLWIEQTEGAKFWLKVMNERKARAKALKPIYAAASADAAAAELDAFEDGPWGEKYPAVTASWRRRWEEVIPFFAFSPEVRRIIYTTNAIESLHSQVRKAIRNKGHFPSDEAATKLIYLALRNIMAKWKRPPKEWHAAKAQLAIQFGDRFTLAA